MEEHRPKQRRRVYKTGRIAFNGGRAAIDCVLRNLSDKGACLRVVSPVGIPETFDLVLDSDNAARPCHVVWRKEKEIGVEFQSKEPIY